MLLMGKGYKLSEEMCGADLEQVLEDAVRQHAGIAIDVQTIVNESFAVYAAGQFLDPDAELALVLGIGLNLCYQPQSSPEFHHTKNLANMAQILFNTEMSFFGRTLVEPYATKHNLSIDGRFKHAPDFRPHMHINLRLNCIFSPASCSRRAATS
ncbi:hypothetical protein METBISCDRAFT_25017 [Metschnikowia bicuspidata]|uniref:Phosphotransferase n=1 Tax=Metschnikowia bicuspidata TaxID=27322 RepID=A0A4V1J2F9_9ASCO|nr:hypothetical protein METBISCDRAFT_25017 [Metschnikowia bicuspidata]